MIWAEASENTFSPANASRSKGKATLKRNEQPEEASIAGVWCNNERLSRIASLGLHDLV